MILATSGIIASQIASFDADAVAFFNRVTTAGGSLSTTEKQAVNQLVVTMKADGTWTPMKAIYPMVGGGTGSTAAREAACAQNLKSASFTGSFSSGWTFASTGATPNGTSAYMDCNLNISANLSQNNTHISIYSRTNVAGLRCDIGGGLSLPALNIFPNFNGDTYFRTNDSGGTAANTNTLGLFMANRISSTESRNRINGVLKIVTTTSTGLQNATIFLGKGENNSFYSTRENAFASIGDGLTDTQASNFYTAVQAFQRTLSRQV
jgi:hypothetical protein